MKKKNNKLKILVIIIIIILIFLLFYLFINDDEKNNIVTNNIKDLTASISNITTISILKNEKNYNKKLAKEINNDYKKEINDLKNTLKLNTINSDKKLVNATVIKRSNNYWYNLITIDKGNKNGIKKGSAVINNKGLIGKVIKVNKHSSDIKLLSSLTNKDYVSASFKYDNKDYYGLLSNYNIEKNELILSNVIGDFDINKIKDINVITSGLSDSFSSGLLIGTIKGIKKDSFGLSNTITITPIVDFNNLNIITVIVGDK